MGVQYSSYATPRLDLGTAYMEFMDAGSMPQFVATDVLPTFRTPRQAAKFSALTRETMLSAAAAGRASRSSYNRVDFGAEDKSYSCEEFGLEGLIDDRERILYSNDFEHESAVLMHVTQKLKLAMEVRTAALVFNTTTWTGSALYTDRSAAPWATVSSDVITHVLAAKEKVRAGTGMEANALILGRGVFEALLSNTGIKAQFPGAPIITLQMVKNALAQIFGLEKLIIGNAVKNTADEGQTASLSDVWGSTYAMVARVADQGAGLQTPCLGRSFLWTPDSPEELVVETYREEQVRGDVLRARHDVDEVILSAEFGHLLKVA